MVEVEDVKIGLEGEEVAAERRRVINMASYDGQSIVLKDLKKVYPAQGGKAPKVALTSQAPCPQYLPGTAHGLSIKTYQASPHTKG